MPKQISRKTIPKGWRQVKLGEIATITNGKTNSQDAVSDGKYPLFDRSAEVKQSNKYLFDATAIILPGEGAEFIPHHYSGKFDLHQRAYAIIPNGSVNSKFLFQYLYLNRRIFAKNAVGSTVKSLRLPIIQKANVLLPSIVEQEKIAEILSLADEKIHKANQIIQKTIILNKTLITRLLTDVAVKIVKLNSISTKITDGAHRTPKYTTSGVPFLRINDVQTDKIDWQKCKYISEKEHEELIKRCKPERGDVLLSKNGTIGIAKMVDWDQEFSIFVSLCLIKPNKEKILPEYLAEVIGSEYVMRQIRKRSKQGTVTNLHLEEIRDFDIPLPEIKEQKKIVEIIRSLKRTLRNHQAILASVTKFKRGLAQDIFSQKIQINKYEI